MSKLIPHISSLSVSVYDETKILVSIGNETYIFNRRKLDYLCALILEQVLDNEVPCESCQGLGYLEVTLPNDKCEIQACQECDFFGIIGNDQNKKARELAEIDGILR